MDEIMASASSNDRISNTFTLVGAAPPSGAAVSGIAVYRTDSDSNYGNPFNTFTGVGIPVGETDHGDKLTINRVGMFDKELWLTQSATMLRFNRGSSGVPSSWESMAAMSGAIAGDSNFLGLHPWFDNTNNKRYLVTAYQVGASSSWIGMRYSPDTNTWESGDAKTLVALPSAGPGVRQVARLESEFYFTGGTDASIYVFNADSLDFRAVDIDSNARLPVDLCAFDNAMYVLYRYQAYVKIGRVEDRVKDAFSPQYEGGDAFGITTGHNQTSRCLLFSDNAPLNLTLASGITGPSLIAIYHVDDTGGRDGWEIWRYQSDGNGGLTFIETLSDSLPSDWAPGGAVHGGHPDSTFKLLKDNVAYFTNSPAQDRILLRNSNLHYATKGEYVWRPDYFKDNATTWPNDATDGTPAPRFAIREDKDGGGNGYAPDVSMGDTGPDGASQEVFDLTYKSGELVGGNLRMHYELFPSTAYPAGTQLIARWLFDPSGLAPTTRCNISSVTGGGATLDAADNIILTIQSGVDYTADWNYGANSLVNFDKVNLAGLLFVSGTLPA